MRKDYFIIIIFVFIVAVIVGVQILNKSNENQKSQTSALFEPVQTLGLEPQSNNDGPVTVIVVPRKSASAGTWEFEITLETHSVELNEDLMKTSVLIADNKNYEPLAWDGDPPGGHHRNGILQFAPISPQPESIALKIRSIGGVEERNFIWQLK